MGQHCAHTIPLHAPVCSSFSLLTKKLVQRGEVTCWQMHSKWAAELGLKSRSTWFQV